MTGRGRSVAGVRSRAGSPAAARSSTTPTCATSACSPSTRTARRSCRPSTRARPSRRSRRPSAIASSSRASPTAATSARSRSYVAVDGDRVALRSARPSPSSGSRWTDDASLGIAYERGLGRPRSSRSTSTRARRGGSAHIPGQVLAALALAGDALVFASYRYGGELWLDDGRGGRVVTHGLGGREVARGAATCSSRRMRDGKERIVELDDAGHVRGALTAGPRDDAPSILPDGKAWTYLRRAGDAPGLYRCAFGGGCARLSDGSCRTPPSRPTARASPTSIRRRTGRARGSSTLAGGAARDVGDASSYCRPVWSSARTLWISRRAAGHARVGRGRRRRRPTPAPRAARCAARATAATACPIRRAPRATAPGSSSTGAPSCACSRAADELSAPSCQRGRLSAAQLGMLVEARLRGSRG